MKPILSEDEIDRLLHEPKPIPYRYLRWIATRRSRNKHVFEGSNQVTGDDGHVFALYFRRSFSIDPETKSRATVRRFTG